MNVPHSNSNQYSFEKPSAFEGDKSKINVINSSKFPKYITKYHNKCKRYRCNPLSYCYFELFTMLITFIFHMKEVKVDINPPLTYQSLMKAASVDPYIL